MYGGGRRTAVAETGGEDEEEAHRRYEMSISRRPASTPLGADDYGLSAACYARSPERLTSQAAEERVPSGDTREGGKPTSASEGGRGGAQRRPAPRVAAHSGLLGELAYPLQ